MMREDYYYTTIANFNEEDAVLQIIKDNEGINKSKIFKVTKIKYKRVIKILSDLLIKNKIIERKIGKSVIYYACIN